MSPEQIKNAKDVDARADLWSAGVMLYEMLTGRVAFPEPTEYARLAAVLNTTPPAIEAVDPSLGRLSAFVQLSMQKDRAQRYQSALEMSRALSAAAGADASAPPPLSRLPDVPSVWAPVGASPVAASAPRAQLPSNPPPPMTVTPATDVSKGPGGTLASPAGHRVTDPPPQVRVVGATAGTMPSEHLPMLSSPDEQGRRRGVAPGLVVALVLGALVAGFLLGFAAARMM